MTAAWLSRARGDGAPAIAAAAAEVLALFPAREAGFGFGPGIIAEVPDRAALLADPAGLIARRCADRGPVGRVVLLTTFGPQLAAPLAAAGFAATAVDWPAGPAGTVVFRRETGAGGPTLYLEAVDEEDPAIAPSFVLRRTDPAGRVTGGAVGVARGDAAWITMLVVAPDQHAGSGSAIARQMLDRLAAEGVRRIDLGTQTAAGFWRSLGWAETLTVVPGLRLWRGPDGVERPSDLVMMRRDLPAPPPVGGKA